MYRHLNKRLYNLCKMPTKTKFLLQLSNFHPGLRPPPQEGNLKRNSHFLSRKGRVGVAKSARGLTIHSLARCKRWWNQLVFLSFSQSNKSLSVIILSFFSINSSMVKSTYLIFFLICFSAFSINVFK